MADRSSLYGKQRICYTEPADFTDFQGIGRDQLYKRFPSVYSVVQKYIPDEYKDFLAHPLYSADKDQIDWYVKDWKETPLRYNELNGDVLEKYSAIKRKTIKAYSDAAASLKGEDRQILDGARKYIDDDFIFCYDDKVVVVAWGMRPDSNKHMVKGTVLHDLKVQNKCKICFDAGEHGAFQTKIDGLLIKENGSTISKKDIPEVIPNPGYEFDGWDNDPLGKRITEDVVFHALYKEVQAPDAGDDASHSAGNTTDSPTKNGSAGIVSNPSFPQKIKVKFDSDSRGILIGETDLLVEKGTTLLPSQFPDVQAAPGYQFDGWDKAKDIQIVNDVVFKAMFSKVDVHCRFDAGTNGALSGTTSFTYPYGTALKKQDIPTVTPDKGYEFTGWNVSPVDYLLKENTVFTAQYEKKSVVPWYKRLWIMLTGSGCLKWLLWLLLAILLILALSLLFRGCGGLGAFGGIHEGNDGFGGDAGDSGVVVPSERIETPDGRTIDDNGSVNGIVGDNGHLPNENVIAPIIGNDGSTPPVIENPGVPDIVGDRLNIYFESEQVDLNKFAADLNEAFPAGECEIIGVDHNVPMLQIKVPSDSRDQIREALPSKLHDYQFFVVDESIFSCTGHVSEGEQDPGWHLKAINLKSGWNYSKGSKDIVVAVVDDGIDANHEILKGRIFKPYNVFTQDNHLGLGDGHGTHVAGLAIGSDKYFEKGISGVAPNCTLMPVQVFDNEMCTFSSVTSGIMYAIHNGAHVVNVSIAPDFNGLDILPISDQEHIARTQFKNEEKVWRRIIQVANSENVILVFAAGNNNIVASVPPENRTDYTVNVAAVARDFKETDFTNYGDGANASAPGMGIVSSVPTDQYAIFDGTSMAAPIVAGTIALMKSVKPEVTVTDVISILQKSGKLISEKIPPMIQVDRALEMLTTGNPPYGSPVNSNQEAENFGNDDSTDIGDYDDGTDYEAIRKMIEYYRGKISELEKLLPENKE